MRYSIKNSVVRRLVCGILAVVSLMCLLPDAKAEGKGSPSVESKGSSVTARDIFVGMQCPALEVLKKTTRLDMLDYWDVDSVYKAVNALDGRSWLEDVTPDYLKVHVTPVSTLQLKILPVKKGSVVMAVYTVGDSIQAEDSEISFYDMEGRQLDGTAMFTPPALGNFFEFPKGSEVTIRGITEMFPFHTVAYSASPGKDDISARLTFGDYMDVDNLRIIRKYLKPEVTLRWNKGRFR